MQRLCIGGPYDGRWMDWGERTWFDAPDFSALEEIAVVAEVPSQTMHIRQTHYVEMTISTGTQVFTLWHPEYLSPATVLSLLIARYVAPQASPSAS